MDSPGLVFSFLILASCMAWLIVRLPGKVLLKMGLIGLLLWYSAGIYFASDRIAGWATRETLPEETYLIDIVPRKDLNAIFLWVIPKSENKSITDYLHPKSLTMRASSEPRAYKIEWSKDTSKQAGIFRKGKEQGLIGIVKLRKGGKNSEADPRNKDAIEVRLIDPRQLLPKQEQNIER